MAAKEGKNILASVADQLREKKKAHSKEVQQQEEGQAEGADRASASQG